MRNTHMNNLLAAMSAMALGALFYPGSARADFPERTVSIVVPFEAGGTVDLVARALASRLNAKWGVSVIVVNRPGAGNTIGANAVARAAPDGYTLLLANTSISINPSLYKTLPYDTERDLTPVSFLAPSPNVLLVQKSLGVDTLRELIALAKSRSNSNPLMFASVGKGSFHHFSMEMFKSEAGVELIHVPYKGVASAIVGFRRGDVDLYCSDLPGALPGIRAGEFKPLAVTGAKRVATLPEVPTMAEAGLPHYAAAGYVGVMATGGTPPDVLAKLNKDINEVVAEPEFRDQFSALGYDMVGSTIEEFAAFLKEDIERYKRLVKTIGATAD
ncbi:MAG: tripartite tricarboxylate transporter substrate binding protein [Xanthobacteraceae bacterium]